MTKPIEFDLYIDPLGNEHNLHDARTHFVMSDTGRGMAPVEYVTESGPLQHGGSFLDYRLRPRLITMVIRRQFLSRQDYWSGRSALLDALRPNRQAMGQFDPGRLRKILPDRSMRDIDVLIESGPVFEPRASDRWDERAFTEVLRFVAQDPTFYDPVTQAQQWALTITNYLVFPMTFPIRFGAAAISAYASIAYAGTWLAYPTIVVIGPANNFLIRNLTTDEELQLAGYDIAAGEIVTFTTQYGKKTVTNQWGVNLLPYLTTDSDLATFHLEPAPGAPGGANQMYVFCSGASPATQVAAYWNARYLGI